MQTVIVKNLQIFRKQVSKFNESCRNQSSFKKLDSTSKDNYRPITALFNFASIFYSQLNGYMENKSSKYLTGFRKNHSTQNSLRRTIESWKAKLNNGSKVGVKIIDLSRTFDSLNHDLLLAKLEAYGLDNNAVRFMRSYLINRLQRCKINNSFSEWAKTSFRVPQGSILDPLLFSIFINILFIQWHLISSKLCWWQYYVYLRQTRVYIAKNTNKKFNVLTWVQNYMATDQKSLYFPPLLNRNLPFILRYGCFLQNVPFAE